MRQVMSITILWIIIGVLVELFYAVSFNPVTRQFFLYFTFGDNALQHLMITAIGPLAGGILAGSFIVFYQREKLKGKTYGRKILIHSFLSLESFCNVISFHFISLMRISGKNLILPFLTCGYFDCLSPGILLLSALSSCWM